MWGAKKLRLPKLPKIKTDLVRSRIRLRSLFAWAETNDQSMDGVTKNLEQTAHIPDLPVETKSHVLAEQPKKRRFVVSSLFLHQCFKELTADSREQFFFITGSETEGLLVLDQRCGFQHLSRTAAGVEGDPKSSHSLLCKLEHFGHRLLAHCHSHPGRGVGATLPSSVDRSFQERLERGGYPTVAAIFSRDGLVRFFRLDNDFELQIFGKGVEEIEPPNIYRLSHLD